MIGLIVKLTIVCGILASEIIKIFLEKIEIRSRIKSALLIAQKYLKKKKLLRLKLQLPLFSMSFINIELLALLRQKAKVIVQNKNVLILQTKNKDYGFKYLDQKILKEAKNLFQMV